MTKKRKFCLKELFPSNCVYGHKENSFDNFAGKLSTTGRVFSARCAENTKKNYSKQCLRKFLLTRCKHFWRARWETCKKRLEIFHSKYTQETSPDETRLLRGFLWTLRLQFRQPCQVTCARMPKTYARCPKKMEKKRTFLVFSSFCSCGLIWQSSTNVYVKKTIKFFLRCGKVWKNRTLFLIFHQRNLREI